MLCVGGEIIAVIDWEIWSVGDAESRSRLVPDDVRSVPPGRDRGSDAGLPPVTELVHAYAAAAGGPVLACPGSGRWLRSSRPRSPALLAKHAAQRNARLEQVTARLATLLPEMQAFAQGFLEQKDDAS